MAKASARTRAEVAVFQAERSVIAREAAMSQQHARPIVTRPGHGAAVVPLVAVVGLSLSLIAVALQVRRCRQKWPAASNADLDDMLDGIEAANTSARVGTLATGEQKSLLGTCSSLDAEQLATRGPV